MELGKEVGEIVLATILFILYWIGMNKLLDSVIAVRKLKKIGPIVEAIIERYKVEEGTDGDELKIPVIRIEGLGCFKYTRGIVSSHSKYNVGDMVELYLDETEYSQSLIVGDEVEGLLIFLSLLLGAGTPFIVILIYFG